MNINNSLFDHYHHSQELNAKEKTFLENSFSYLRNSHIKTPAYAIPDSLSQDCMRHFVKSAHSEFYHHNQEMWTAFLEFIATNGLVEQVQNPTIKNFLLIELAKHYPLSRFTDLDTRIQLAYSAIHGDSRHRKIFLSHAKRFEIDDRHLLADLAFKGIILGGLDEIELIQFLPQDRHVLFQLLLALAQVSKEKAQIEVAKIKQIDPKLVEAIEVHLKSI